MQIGSFIIDISFGDVCAIITLTYLTGYVWEFIEGKVKKYRKSRATGLIIDAVGTMAHIQRFRKESLFVIPQTVKESELEAEIKDAVFEGVPADRMQKTKDLIGKYVRIEKDK